MYEASSEDIENANSLPTEKLLPKENFLTERDEKIRVSWKIWAMHAVLLTFNTLFYVYSWHAGSRTSVPCVHDGHRIYCE
jgi:hypothetical protein